MRDHNFRSPMPSAFAACFGRSAIDLCICASWFDQLDMRDPLALSAIRQQPLDRRAIEQHPGIRPDMRERTPLSFGPQPLHRNAQESGEFREFQRALAIATVHG